jgi:secretion/DNA translocation related TadE-like protein
MSWSGAVAQREQRTGQRRPVAHGDGMSCTWSPQTRQPPRSDVGSDVREGDDTGSSTILVLGICLGAFVLVLVLVGLGSAVIARHRASSAADLAALAAADVRVGRAAGAACDAAQHVVRLRARDGLRLTSCHTEGRTGEVSVTARPGGWVSALGPARGRARAGPSLARPG